MPASRRVVGDLENHFARSPHRPGELIHPYTLCPMIALYWPNVAFTARKWASRKDCLMARTKRPLSKKPHRTSDQPTNPARTSTAVETPPPRVMAGAVESDRRIDHKGMEMVPISDKKINPLELPADQGDRGPDSRRVDYDLDPSMRPKRRAKRLESVVLMLAYQLSGLQQKRGAS